MPFDISDPIYRELQARVVESGAKVVPFVGAGVSVYGTKDDRLPLWSDLLDRLVAEGQRLGLIADAGDPIIDSALRAGRYIEATDRILEALGEPTFRRAVERELDDREKPVPPGVTELVGINWSLIVTTNLDRLIARAYLERRGHPIVAVTSLDTRRLAAALAGTLATPETVLVQLHGDVDVYPSWRLTKAHYDQLLRDLGYVEALKHLFLRQVFFVGYGLRDDDFDFMVKTVAAIYPAGVGEFYALVDRSRRKDPVIQQLVRMSGLRPIFYDVDAQADPDDPFGGHRAVYECLSHLAATWARATTQLDVTLQYFPELDPFVVGQDEDADRLTALLTRDCATVIQVVGMGGTGKTSLVQHVIKAQRVNLADAGHRRVFGCCFYRADIGQFIEDFVNNTLEPAALPLPEQVDRICAHLSGHRTVLVLDGIEVILDEEHRVRNPYLVQVVEAVLEGRGSVVVTSRVPVRSGVFEHSETIDVTPLQPKHVRAVLNHWGLDRLGEVAMQRLLDVTAGHPLAVRILASVLHGVPEDQAIGTIEQSVIIGVADEVDPLRENRLARILGSYLQHLDEAEEALLVGSTAFEGPVSYPALEAAVARRYPDTAVNAALVDRDLRPMVARLLELRLLTTSATGELSSHPTVRQFFARRAQDSGLSLIPLHRFLARQLLQGAPQTPETFEEAAPLVVACRHAAASADWTLFDSLFRHRLMRGFRSYLCNNLGAWEEALGLARLGADPSFPASLTAEPAYYPITVARCLKHLGRSAEARARYLDGLGIAARTRDPESARYVNNLLTLLVWRGELINAEQLVELNFRAISWIAEPWKRRWQTEHALSTVAYLRLLRGELDVAADLFEASRHAWDEHPGGRLTTFDHYPFHRGELVLLADPMAHGEAVLIMQPLLDVAEANSWPEAICRGHIQIALVLLDSADVHQEPTDLTEALQRLEIARSVTAGMSIPDVEIAYLVAHVRAELVRQEIGAGPRPVGPPAWAALKRVDALVRATGLQLALPEVLAARGLLALIEGRSTDASKCHDEAVRVCVWQGNELALRSRRSLVAWLGERLNRVAHPSSSVVGVDPFRLLGADLSAEQMELHLRQVAGDDRSHSEI